MIYSRAMREGRVDLQQLERSRGPLLQLTEHIWVELPLGTILHEEELLARELTATARLNHLRCKSTTYSTQDFLAFVERHQLLGEVIPLLEQAFIKVLQKENSKLEVGTIATRIRSAYRGANSSSLSEDDGFQFLLYTYFPQLFESVGTELFKLTYGEDVYSTELLDHLKQASLHRRDGRPLYQPPEGIDLVMSLCTFTGNFDGLLGENANLVPTILKRIFEKLPGKYSEIEKYRILAKNAENLKHFFWFTLRVGVNGYLASLIDKSASELIVRLDHNGQLLLDLTDYAKEIRSKGGEVFRDDKGQTIELKGISQTRIEWQQLLMQVRSLSERYPDLQVCMVKRALHYAGEQSKCPVQDRRLYDMQLDLALGILNIFTTL